MVPFISFICSQNQVFLLEFFYGLLYGTQTLVSDDVALNVVVTPIIVRRRRRRCRCRWSFVLQGPFKMLRKWIEDDCLEKRYIGTLVRMA